MDTVGCRSVVALLELVMPECDKPAVGYSVQSGPKHHIWLDFTRC